MFFFLLVCWGFLVLYSCIIGNRLRSWMRMTVLKKKTAQPVTRLSVLIPVRNEAKSIQLLLQDLEAQSFPKHLLEVLVMDDHSEDETATIVTRFSAASQLDIRLIYLQDYPGLQHKKAAIATGVGLATGELIIQTDGDCRVMKDWLTTVAHFYEQTGAKCISGPVCLVGDNSIFTGMQVVEFAGLIGIGGASIASGQPNMCNGANLAYVRQAFLDVQGFTGNEHLASGDDEFLMHKLTGHYPGQVFFLKAPEAVVFTDAKTSVKAFLEQRVRWASKWPNYTQLEIKLLAVIVFGVNLFLFLSSAFWLSGVLPGWHLTLLYSLKFLTDGLFLAQVLRFFNRRRYIWYILPLQIVYIPYVLYTALLGLRGNYNWKGRQIK